MATEYNGNSLNKALLTGPDLLNSLVGIILWFHNYRVAFSADIEAICHQVWVNSDDADALRFLWLENFNSWETWYMSDVGAHLWGKRFTFLCKLCSQKNSIKSWQQIWCSSCWMCQKIFLRGWSSKIYWNWRTSSINYKTVHRINANWWIQLEKISQY